MSSLIDQFLAAEKAAEPEREEITNAALSAEEIIEGARNSLDFLAALTMPAVFRYFFPPVFITIWKWLISYVHKVRDFSQLAIGLPRGFGKTIVIKLFVLYCIFFTKKQFILIICGTQTKANNILTDIFSMLSEDNVKTVFGDWRIGIETERQDLKRFAYRGRTLIVMGAGAQSDIRGITLENQRPDVMIFDDIQTRDDADSEEVSKKLLDWMLGTAMKAKSPMGCLFIFIANMYPTPHSILKKLKSNPTWVKFIAGGILADGTSLWEELQPIQQLLKEYQNDASMGREEIFNAEVLNDENASINNLINLHDIPAFPYEGEKMHQGNFIVIDPSNDKNNSDAVSIGYYEIFDGKPACQEIIEGRLSPGDTIKEALKLALRKNCRVIGVESNAYQYSLLYWFGELTRHLGLDDAGFHFMELYSGKRSKNSRILDMFKSLLAGEVWISANARPATDAQIKSFNPLKTNNTDGILDLHTYAPKMIELYGDLITSSYILEAQEFHALPASETYETSCF